MNELFLILLDVCFVVGENDLTNRPEQWNWEGDACKHSCVAIGQYKAPEKDMSLLSWWAAESMWHKHVNSGCAKTNQELKNSCTLRHLEVENTADVIVFFITCICWVACMHLAHPGISANCTSVCKSKWIDNVSTTNEQHWVVHPVKDVDCADTDQHTQHPCNKWLVLRWSEERIYHHSRTGQSKVHVAADIFPAICAGESVVSFR